MATFILREYETVAPTGEPVQPPKTQTNDVAVDTPTRLGANTVYADVTPSADMYFYIVVGAAGVNASATNGHKVLAGETRGFPVSQGARPWVAGH